MFVISCPLSHKHLFLCVFYTFGFVMAPVINGSTSDNIRNFALALKTVHIFRIKEKPVQYVRLE